MSYLLGLDTFLFFQENVLIIECLFMSLSQGDEACISPLISVHTFQVVQLLYWASSQTLKSWQAPGIFTKHNSFQASFGINDSAVFLKRII